MSNLGLLYHGKLHLICIGYSDADWAEQEMLGIGSPRLATCFCLEEVLSAKQACVALSTTEAEYVALSAAAQEVIGCSSCTVSSQTQTFRETEVFEDNQSTIMLG